MKAALKLLAGAAAMLPMAAHANDISPWTPAAGGGEVEISWQRQTADTFNPGDATAPLPTDLSQSALVLNGSYGISDRLAIDVEIGYAKSKFLTDPVLAPNGGTDGLTDVRIGARFKVLDELSGSPLTATLGIAGIIDGGYETGSLPAIGDGGSGGQVALALGKQAGPVSLSADIGYKIRSNNVPDEVFGSAKVAVALGSRFSVYGGLAFVDSASGLDIGGPGFSPARFPEVEEDYKLWTVGAAASLTDSLSLNATYGEKFDGRNTAESNVVRIGIGYSF